ncbi:hypothetical protein MTBGP_09760 [Moorella thermoacetica]|uniref:hypothetical protein n=1 Tax=Neomoorella thermoacetica TaxID=1525 RepID=UPI0030D194D6
MNDIARLLAEDARDKRKARGGRVISKKRPKVVIMPDSQHGEAPWWKIAPDILRVDIATGRVLVNRWPLLEGYVSQDVKSAGR